MKIKSNFVINYYQIKNLSAFMQNCINTIFKAKHLLIALMLLILIYDLVSASYQIPPEYAEYSDLIEQLNQYLTSKGISNDWLTLNMQDENFRIYEKMPDYFYNMPENKVKRNEETLESYMASFRLDDKIVAGFKFIEDNLELFKSVEKKNGIHYEIIAAILGIETNFASNRHKGNFYAFSSLISQYVLMPQRRDFASKQLVELYRFSQRINKPVYYFIGSYASACGYSQFIPSSLNTFFVDSKGIDFDIDIYSLDDSVFSIENYLYEHNLNRLTISDYLSLYKAVYAYNPSDAYTKAVLYLYDGLYKMRVK